jgi:GntR family transcriptional repressor for pyruvate dehydrogenase complex
MALRKLSRQTLADLAIESLLDYIDEGSLRPGDVLPSEAILAARLGVSRPVIREALKALGGRNVIEVVNGKGAIVKPIGSDDLSPFFRRAVGFDKKAIRELLQVRQGLEVQSARLAASLRTDDELEQLEQIAVRMRALLYEGEAFVDADLEFHLCVAAATHNSILYYLIVAIRDAMRDSILQWHYRRHTVEEHERVQRTHDALLVAIRTGDPEAAAAAMTEHFIDALSFLDASEADTPTPAQ